MTDNNKLLQDAHAALSKATEMARKQKSVLEEDRKNLITSIGRDILGVLHPLLERIAENSKINREEIKRAISESSFSLTQDPPVVNIPAFPEFPKIPAPVVHYTPPLVKVPDIRMPEEMDIKGWVQLQGVDLGHPLPVQLRDAKGNPVNLLENLTTVIGGGGGGGIRDYLTVADIQRSGFSMINDAESALRVTGTVTTSGAGASSVSLVNADAAYYNSDNPLPVLSYQSSGAVYSVSVVSEGVTLETIQVSGSVNSVQAKPIAMTTNPTAVADGVAVFQKSDKIGRAINRPVQVRELIASAYVTLATGSGFGTETTLLAGGAAGVFNDLIYVMGANNSDAAVIVDIRDGTAAGIVMSIAIPANGTSGVATPVPLPQNAATNAWTVDAPDISGTTVYITGLFSKEI